MAIKILTAAIVEEMTLDADSSLDGESSVKVDEIVEELDELSSEDLVETIIGAYLLFNTEASDEQVHALAFALGIGKEELEEKIYALSSEMLTEATASVEDDYLDETISADADNDDNLEIEEADGFDEVVDLAAEDSGETADADEIILDTPDEIDDELHDPEMDEALSTVASNETADLDDNAVFDGMPDDTLQEEQKRLIDNEPPPQL